MSHKIVSYVHIRTTKVFFRKWCEVSLYLCKLTEVWLAMDRLSKFYLLCHNLSLFSIWGYLPYFYVSFSMLGIILIIGNFVLENEF